MARKRTPGKDHDHPGKYRAHPLPPDVRFSSPQDPDVVRALPDSYPAGGPSGRGAGSGPGEPDIAPSMDHYLYRDQVLVHAEDDEMVADFLRANSCRRSEVQANRELDVVIWDHLVGDLAGGLSMHDLVEQARTPRQLGALGPYCVPNVGPNTVLTFEWHGEFGPAKPASPAASVLKRVGSHRRGFGKGVNVHVIDTGFSPADRKWFGGRAGGDPEDPADLDPGAPLPWWAGHGTFIAGTVLRYAPAATVYVHRLPSAGGTFADTDLAAKIDEITRAGEVHVLSLSVAGTTHANTGLISTDRAIHRLLSRNPLVAVIAAAGNDGANVPTYPGASKGVFAVGATNSDGQPTAFTNRGATWVDCCVDGDEVLGPFVDHPSYPAPYFVNWSGTSFAAPAFAGTVAAALSPGTGLNPYARFAGAQGPREAASRLVHDPAAPRVAELGTFIQLRSLL